MALATRCPNCSALFRVGADQLRTRNGMVRCGSCRHVFNAIGRLDYVEPGALSAAASARTARVQDPPAAPTPTNENLAPSADLPAPTPAPSWRPPEPIEAAVMDGAAASVEPMLDEDLPAAAAPSIPSQAHEILLTLGPATGSNAENSGQNSVDRLFFSPDEGDAAVEAPPVEDEPTFLRQPPAGRQRATRLAMGVGCVLLFPMLLLQAALLFRADLLARFPELRPVMTALCAPLACTAQWPMRPEMLAVVSSELQAVPGTPALELDAVIRNRADFPMALPALELTLTDTLNHTVGRKVFLPEEYQATSATDARVENLGAGADLSIRLLFELPGSGASGFVAYPFYP